LTMKLPGNTRKVLLTLAVMAVLFAVSRPYVAYLLYKSAGDYMSASLIPDAARSYRKSLIFDGSDVDTRTWLAYCYSLLGRTDEAVAEYNTAIAQDADNVMAYFDLGVIYRDIGDKELARKMFVKGRDCRRSVNTTETNYRFYTRSCRHMLDIMDKESANTSR